MNIEEELEFVETAEAVSEVVGGAVADSFGVKCDKREKRAIGGIGAGLALAAVAGVFLGVGLNALFNDEDDKPKK